MRKIVTSLFLFISLFQAGFPQEGSLNTETQSPLSIEEFSDGLLKGLMAEHEIPGAVLVVVKGNETLFSKGYGYANLQEKSKVNPDTTMFRIGSISKLLIWTSIMQLQEKGQLDLNADITQYLGDFTLKKKNGQRITLRNLMSHTAGFEERILGLMGEDESSMEPLEKLLEEDMPSLVRPPNSQASYSNHGSALAALIVEKVSGLDFETYVDENILHPLGMNFSTLSQPVPEPLTPYLSQGYSGTSNPVAKEFEFIRAYPAGAASSSGADMAKWMKMYLGEGTFQESTILDSATFREMIKTAFSHHPNINPMLHGFLDLSRNNTRAYGHFGDTFWFHSMMLLVPEEKIGVFLSLNGSKGTLTYLGFYEQFMDKFFPERNPQISEIKLTEKLLDELEGDYKLNRYSKSDLTKITSLFARYKVEKGVDNSIRVDSPLGTSIYLPEDSLLFRKSGSSEKIAFGKDDEGKVKFLYADLLPMMVMEKTPWYEGEKLHLFIFVTATLVSFFILCFWPMVFLSRRRFYPSDPNRRYLPFSSKSLAWTNAFLYLCFIIGVSSVLSDPLALLMAIPTSFKLLLFLPILFTILTLLMLVHGLKIFEIAAISIRTKIFYFILVLVNISVVFQLFCWNLLGWQY
ncbi:serine hydrolase domain-containing protein [Pleomorphovibrio marinus]|uniref:serine hydrolase domain-containing protein n=1 Tax=Pleomorphovibrio marinus TaxID=2164132 RepID=UPI0013003946|nr:serine hydrolase domain-containing protein [Pleomorphovibrio marinus]